MLINVLFFCFLKKYFCAVLKIDIFLTLGKTLLQLWRKFNRPYFCISGIALATYFLRVQIIVLKRGKRSYTESHPFLLEEFTELFLSTGLEKSIEEQHDKNSTTNNFRLLPLLEEFTQLYISTGLENSMEQQHDHLQ